MFCRYRSRIGLGEFNWVVIETKSCFLSKGVGFNCVFGCDNILSGACNVADSILSGACKGGLTRGVTASRVA